MKRKSIFTTTAESPVKNIPTPIHHLNRAVDEEEELIEQPADQEDVVVSTTTDDVCRMLGEIKVLLLILVIMKVICLIRKG